jgi:hypothetical protein
MLEKLNDLPRGIDGLKAIGRITREDYDKVVEPILDAARRDGRRIRFLYELGADFDGFTPGAAWEDAKVGFRSLRLFDGCAIVSDVGWIRESARFFGFIMPCPVRVFENQARGKAIEWLGTLPETPAISQRLIPESGVIVVEVKSALRAPDFDALAVTADAWIEAHGDLRGIVIHAREFPGWENLGSLVRHVQFVRDHQRKVKRVALAVDSKLAGLLPRVAEHFVKAEVKTFGYDALDSAIAWARGSVAA